MIVASHNQKENGLSKLIEFVSKNNTRVGAFYFVTIAVIFGTVSAVWFATV